MDDNSPNNSSPLDIHIDRLTQQPGESVPPEMRRNDSDRRQEDLGPPDGVEDRRKGDRDGAEGEHQERLTDGAGAGQGRTAAPRRPPAG